MRASARGERQIGVQAVSVKPSEFEKRPDLDGQPGRAVLFVSVTKQTHGVDAGAGPDGTAVVSRTIIDGVRFLVPVHLKDESQKS